MSGPTIRGAYDRAMSLVEMMRGADQQARALRDRSLHNVPCSRETTESVAHYIEQSLMQCCKLAAVLEELAAVKVYDRRSEPRDEPRKEPLPDPDHNVIGGSDPDLPLPADFLVIHQHGRRDSGASEFIEDIKRDMQGRAQ